MLRSHPLTTAISIISSPTGRRRTVLEDQGEASSQESNPGKAGDAKNRDWGPRDHRLSGVKRGMRGNVQAPPARFPELKYCYLVSDKEKGGGHSMSGTQIIMSVITTAADSRMCFKGERK